MLPSRRSCRERQTFQSWIDLCGRYPQVIISNFLSMSLVRIKEKYQITVPLELRERLGLELGDYLEASVEDGRLILTPKDVVDRDPVASLSVPQRAS